MPLIQAQVLSNSPAGEHVRKLTLALPGAISWTFQAGQFVILPVPQRPPSTGSGQAQDSKAPKGYFSVASSPAELPKLELLVEHRPEGGYVSGWVSARQAGDSLYMEGPLGHFGLHAEDAQGVVFLGTRAGVAPLRSMLLSSLAKGGPKPHWLFLGAASEADLLLDAEWRSLAEVDKHFHYHPALTPSDPAEAMLAALPQRSGLQVYLAGFSSDVEPMKAKLLAAGIQESAIKMEKFG